MILSTLPFQEELANHKRRIGEAIQAAGGALKGDSISGSSTEGCSYWYTIPAILAYTSLAGMTVTGTVVLHSQYNTMNLHHVLLFDINFFITFWIKFQFSTLASDMCKNTKV